MPDAFSRRSSGNADQASRDVQERSRLVRVKLIITAAVAALAAGTAGAQSSNTSSNSSSNNGVVRERIVDTYCDRGYCERYVQRRVYRDDRRGWRGRDRDRERYDRDRDRDEDDDD
jgi:hypothetical protein